MHREFTELRGPLGSQDCQGLSGDVFSFLGRALSAAPSEENQTDKNTETEELKKLKR